MADFIARIKPKRSTVSGEVPTAADLEVGEIAVSTADGKLFVKHSDDTIRRSVDQVVRMTALSRARYARQRLR